MATLGEVLKSFKNFWKLFQEWVKDKGSTATIILAIIGSFGYNYTHFEEKIEDIGSIPTIRKDANAMKQSFDSIKVEFDIMGKGFESMYESYKKDTAEFRAAVGPLKVEFDSMKAFCKKLNVYENFMLDNRYFIDDLYERLEEINNN